MSLPIFVGQGRTRYDESCFTLRKFSVAMKPPLAVLALAIGLCGSTSIERWESRRISCLSWIHSSRRRKPSIAQSPRHVLVVLQSFHATQLRISLDQASHEVVLPDAAQITLRGGGIEGSKCSELCKHELEVSPRCYCDRDMYPAREVVLNTRGGAESGGTAVPAGGSEARDGDTAKRDVVSTPAPHAPAPEKTVAAQGGPPIDSVEEGLRSSLLHAQGTSKILREVERIPALLRLSDSALRVTSATDADGRLAALALYRLGVAARAAETASPTSSTSTPSPTPPATAAPADPPDASASIPTPSGRFDSTSSEGSANNGEGSSPAGNGVIDEGHARDQRRREGQGDGEGEGDGDGDGRQGEDLSGESVSRSGSGDTVGAPESDSSDAGAELKLPEVDGVDGVSPLASPAQEAPQASLPTMSTTEEGASRADEEQQTDQEVTGENRDRDRDRDQDQDLSQSQAQAQAQAQAQVQSPELPAFDLESVLSDQRFEQLIEIVECTASRLSVSDISKVVWGLSILGHVPRNNLLESLAQHLTNRLRAETAHTRSSRSGDPPSGDASSAADVGTDVPSGDAGLDGSDGSPAHDKGIAHGDGGSLDDVSGGSGSSGSSGSSLSVSPGEDPKSQREDWSLDQSNAGPSPLATEGARERSEGADVEKDVKADAADKSPCNAEDASSAPAVTSGTDLATAALSFAYAYARLDLSTTGLLEAIAECVRPRLRSMLLRDLSNLAWGFAAQGYLDQGVMAGVAHEVISDEAVGSMTAKESSLLAWSFGMLGLGPEKVLKVLVREGLATIGDAMAQDLSNLAWGLARSRSFGRELEIIDPAIYEDGLCDSSVSKEESARASAGSESIVPKEDQGAVAVDPSVSQGTGDENLERGGETLDAAGGTSAAAGQVGRPPRFLSTDADDFVSWKISGDPKTEADVSGDDGDETRKPTGPWGWIWQRGRRKARGEGSRVDFPGDIHGHGTDSVEAAGVSRDDGATHGEFQSRDERGLGVKESAGRVDDEGEATPGSGVAKHDDGGDVSGDEGDLSPASALGTEEAEGAEGAHEDDETLPETKLGEVLLAKALEKFRLFQPKQLARLSWALGAWHEGGTVLPGAGSFAARALTEAGQHPRDYTPEELAQILWSFAKLVGNADSPGQELAALVGALAAGFEWGEGYSVSDVGGRVRIGGGLDATSACDVLWSLAAIGHPAHSLCEAAGRSLVDQVPELPLSAVAKLVWAHARMGHPSAELMERVLSVVERRLDDFSVEEASSALWALGALGYTVSLKRQFHVRKEDLRSLSPSAAANLFWGLVKTEAAFAEDFDRECLEAVAADMGPKLLSFSPRELCRTAWALGRLSAGRGGLESYASASAAFVEGATDNDDGAPAEDDAAASLVEGVGKAGGELRGLLEKLLGECSKWLELLTPQDLETLLWAICRAEHRADGLVAAMVQEAAGRQEGLSKLLEESGPTKAKDAAFHLGVFRYLLTLYKDMDFDGERSKGRYQRGKTMLSRMFRER